MSKHPRINPQIEISPLDSESREPMVLCQVPAADRFVRYGVPTHIVDLLNLFDGGRSVEEAIAFHAQRPDCRHPVDHLRRLIETVLIPRGFLVQDGNSASGRRHVAARKRSFLYIKLPLISSNIVDPIARALRWAYRRSVLTAALAVFLLAHVYFYAELLPRHDLDFNQLDIGAIVILMLLSTIGTFLHELGHASAAAFYGCKRLEIGWGLYLVFTVLYTDVSEAWKLRRRERAVVDMGGIYFQSVFLVLMLALFALTGEVVFLFSFLLTDLAIASSLNPFLRLDGYWLISDLFGILNLRQQMNARFLGGCARLLRIQRSAPAALPGLNRKATVALALYCLGGTVFFFFVATVFVERVVVNVVTGYPEIAAAFLTDLHRGVAPTEMARAAVEIFWRTMMLVGMAFMLFNLLHRLAELAQKGLRRLRRHIAPAAGWSA